MKNKETRHLSTRIETRAKKDGKAKGLHGYAVEYNKESKPMLDIWGDEFVEEVAPEAFAESLQERNQVALFNHNVDLILGSVKAGTLQLTSDNTGLNFDIDLPGTTAGHDCWESVNRGDIDGVSFTFRAIDDKWSEVERDGKTILKRTILKADLFEISPCTFPAYPDSQVSCRSLDEHKNELAKRKLELELELYG